MSDKRPPLPGRDDGSWALRRGERLQAVLTQREPLLAEIEENAVFRSIAAIEHANSRTLKLRFNESVALIVASLCGLVPVILGFWRAAPVAVVLGGSIYYQARARQRSEALGRFLQANPGMMKDLMMAGLSVRDWSVAFWARHLVIQRPYWILAFNVLLLVAGLGVVMWWTPYWINDRMVPLLLSALAFSHMFFIAWYNARLRYLPWTDLPSVVFQPKAFRLGFRYLKRIPLQIDQARVAVLTQFWVLAVMGAGFAGGQLILMAEASGRLAGWRESMIYPIVTFPPIWLGPGLFLGSLAGIFWGARCERRAEALLEKLDLEVARLLELIRRRTESDEG